MSQQLAGSVLQLARWQYAAVQMATNRQVQSSAAVHVQDLLGKQNKVLNMNKPPVVEMGRGAAVREGDAASSAGHQPLATADPVRAKTQLEAAGEKDWTEAYKEAPELDNQPYTYPRESADTVFGAKDRAPDGTITDKAAELAKTGAKSLTDAAANFVNVLKGNEEAAQDRKLRPANMNLPQDYESTHQKGRTVKEGPRQEGPTLK